MAVSFNIHEGMTPGELLAEVKGKISGENQRQIQVFERRLKPRANSLPVLTIKVDESSQTAIVRVATAQTDSLGLPVLRDNSQTWVMGINDEGQYYAHEIENVPRNIHTMQDLMGWMNREDQEFTYRVQGDILLQFVRTVPIEDGAKRLLSGPLEGKELYVDADPIDNFERNMIGNHKILTPVGGHARSVWASDARYWVVSGSQLILLHPEHNMQTIQIPPNHVAILTPQRGNNHQVD